MPSQSLANSAFIGIEGGITHQFAKIKLKHNGAKADFEEKIEQTFSNVFGAISIKSGYDFEKFRTYGQYNYIFESKNSQKLYEENFDLTDDFKLSSHEILVGADYFLYATQNFRLFSGLYVGLSIKTAKPNFIVTTQDEVVAQNDKKKTKNSFLLGAKFGAIYSINTHNDVEFGIKIDKSFHKDWKISKTVSFIGYTYKF